MRHLISGFSAAWKQKRLVLAAYIGNLLCGIILFYPLLSLLNQFADRSLSAGRLGGGFDLEIFVEFLRYSSGASAAIVSLAFTACGFAAVINTLVAAGAYGMIVQGEPWSFPAFFSHAGAYGARFLRLLLWCLPLYLVFTCLQFLGAGIIRLFFGKDPYQSIVVWGGVIRALLAGYGILLAAASMDYARIRTVRTNERSMWRAARHGVGFTFRHLFGVSGLTLACGLPAFCLILLPPFVAVATGLSGTAGTAMLIVLQQFALLLQSGLTIVLCGAQASYHRSKVAEASDRVEDAGAVVDLNPLLTV